MKPLTGIKLKRFLRDYRRTNPPRRQLTVLLHSVAYPVNVGSIFRLADALGGVQLVLSGITPQPPQPTLEKVARYKTDRVAWRYVADPLPAIAQLKMDGYQIVALELTDESQPYHQFEYGDKVCLIAGNEDHGVTKATLSVCDAAIFLPMYGKGRSLNVHVAVSVAAYRLMHL